VAKGVWGFLQTINSRALQDAMDRYESKKEPPSQLISCLVMMGCIPQAMVTPYALPTEPSPDLVQQFIMFQQLQQLQKQHDMNYEAPLSFRNQEQIEPVEQKEEKSEHSFRKVTMREPVKEVKEPTREPTLSQQVQQLPVFQSQLYPPQQLQPQTVQIQQQPPQAPQLVMPSYLTQTQPFTSPPSDALPPLPPFVQVTRKTNAALSTLLPTPNASPRQVLRSLGSK
jgi:hypothetical protein